MSRKLKRIIAGLLTVTAVFAAVLPAAPVLGASQKDKKVISLGSGLTGEEKKTVLGILGVSEADLSSYTVITVTEEDERRIRIVCPAGDRVPQRRRGEIEEQFVILMHMFLHGIAAGRVRGLDQHLHLDPPVPLKRMPACFVAVFHIRLL